MLPAEDSEGGDLDEFRALVKAAFEQALSSGKSTWEEMTSAVLKNRLLNLTQGQFTESRYGSPNFIHLVHKVPDLLSVTSSKPPFNLRINSAAVSSKEIKVDQGIPPLVSAGTFAPLTEKDWRKARIRDDLWRAVLDYASGETYVLDIESGHARPGTSNDSNLPLAPTVSSDAVASWRNEFIESLALPVAEKFAEELRVWKAGKGRQSDLPHSVRGLWSGFIKKKVSGILFEWFDRLGESPPKDLIQTPNSRVVPPAEAIQEVVHTRQLRDYIIRAIRVMTYEELVQVTLPASVMLRASDQESR